MKVTKVMDLVMSRNMPVKKSIIYKAAPAKKLFNEDKINKK